MLYLHSKSIRCRQSVLMTIPNLVTVEYEVYFWSEPTVRGMSHELQSLMKMYNISLKMAQSEPKHVGEIKVCNNKVYIYIARDECLLLESNE
jgi:hypothetical protein